LHCCTPFCGGGGNMAEHSSVAAAFENSYQQKLLLERAKLKLSNIGCQVLLSHGVMKIN